jgi:hypothetical protein
VQVHERLESAIDRRRTRWSGSPTRSTRRRDRLRGAHLVAPGRRRAGRGGFEVEHGVDDLDTAVVARPARDRCGSGSAPSTTRCRGSATPAGTTSSPPPGSVRRSRSPRWRTTSGIEVRLLGTPAEEGGGGKILMMERGAFDGLHAAMMVHPAPYESPTMPCLAVQHFEVRYRGRSAHASAYPQQGINAADALTVAQVAVGLLRQHIRRPTASTASSPTAATPPTSSPNAPPAVVRPGRHPRGARRALPQGAALLRGRRLATGATVSFDEPGPAYSEFLHDEDLVAIYRQEAEAVGRAFPETADRRRSWPGRPTWRTCRSRCRRSTRCSRSTPAGR